MNRSFTLPGIVLTAALLLFPVPAEGQTLNDFFDNSQLQELQVRMAPEDWATLKAKYTEDTWFRCEVQWRNLVLPDSGIRSRGSGSRNSIKPGLGIDFSKFASAQRLLGLKSIVLRNSVQDPSMMREFLAQQFHRRMGVITSREAHALVYVNGVFEGVYLMVEPIDKRFLKSRFGEDTGFLYEMQPWQDYHFEWRGDDPAAYVPKVFEPKTRENEAHTGLAGFIRTITQTPDEAFQAAIERAMDPGAFITWIAVEQFLSNWDSILNATGMSNFYLYQRTLDNRWYFLIWDEETAFSDGHRPIWEGTAGNILISRILAIPQYRQRYLETLQLASEIGGGGYGWLFSETERLYMQLRIAVHSDPNLVCTIDGLNQPCTAEEFEQSVLYLQNVILDREPFLKTELASLVRMPVNAPWLHPEGAQLVPGSLLLLETNGGLDGEAYVQSAPVPTEMAGIQVKLGTEMAPIHSVSQGHVWLQVPQEAPCGPLSLEVEHHGSPSNTILVQVRPSYPSILAVTHATGIPVSPANPADRSELLIVYLTGLGPTAFAPPTGAFAPIAIVPATSEVTAQLSGKPAEVAWAGLAPGLIGVQQAIIRVPSEAAAGHPVALVLIVSGEPGPPFSLDVR